MLTAGSVGMARGNFTLHFRSSFSVVSCWSVVSKNTGCYRARPVGSMFTSIGFLRKTSQMFLGLSFD